ncbi:uncharacterized protein LOC143912551 [Arctopsyche grandis]|uniref:uncharacterized protein LOC143912551 n=1 Tax=Arctopsyche grandis TaxID=121162 RepID=UPI00406D83B2
MAISRLSFIKFLELALTCICFGIHYISFECGDIHRAILTTGTFFGFIIVMIGLAAGYVLQAPIDIRIDIFFSLIGCTLFVASGAWTIEAYQHSSKGEYRDMQFGKAAMAFINGAVFLVDAILTFSMNGDLPTFENFLTSFNWLS